MIGLYQSGIEHRGNLLLEFSFLEMWVAVWFYVDEVGVRDEVNMVLDGSGGWEFVWFAKYFWELGDDGSNLKR